MQSPSRLTRRQAFGLTELVVAVALLAILVALLTSVGSRVMQASRKTRCLNNFRQIGQAISLYIVENNGKLPGPMTDGQRLGYSLSEYSDQFHIPRMLGKYLGLPPARSATQFASSISCISWFTQLKESADPNRAPAYIMCSITIDGEVLRPFGRTTGMIDPMRYAAIPEPATRKAMVEADAEVAPSWAAQLPSRPIHGASGRHTLFFDWHAEYVR